MVSENCGDVVWTNNLAGYMVTCGGNAAITVRFTATDACGHTVTTTATFTVVDTIVPEWNEELPRNTWKWNAGLPQKLRCSP